MHDLPEIPLPVRYRVDAVVRLGELGVEPKPTTPPRLVYQFLRALMWFEVRERKHRRREIEGVFGPQPLEPYAREIALLRTKYELLRRPLTEWVEE